MIELVATLAVAALVGAVALPTWQALHGRVLADTAVAQVRLALSVARYHAALARVGTAVCPAAAGGPACGDDWSDGLLVFEDPDGDGRRAPDEVVLRRFAKLPAGVLQWRAFGVRHALRFSAQGVTRWNNGSFLYCPASGERRLARMLIVNAAGRARLARDRNRDGILEDARGRPLQC